MSDIVPLETHKGALNFQDTLTAQTRHCSLVSSQMTQLFTKVNGNMADGRHIWDREKTFLDVAGLQNYNIFLLLIPHKIFLRR